MENAVIVKGYNNAKKVKPMDNYLKGKDLYNKAVLKANWDKDMAMFNAYKHNYTNYDRIMYQVYTRNLTWTETLETTKQVYIQLMSQVPEKYKKACKESFIWSLKELQQHIQELDNI